MSVQIHHEVLDDLLCDPVFASKALMGWDFDDFQAAAMKLDWWFPWTIDSSGTGTGKTRRMFALANLRAILCANPNPRDNNQGQWVGCYFPTWGQVGKQEFWPYFYSTLRTAPSIYRDQFAWHRGRVHEEKGASCWTMNYRNHSKVEMPAPNFLQDASTQAGRSFNTLMVDEWLKCAGNGLDSQLIERARRPAWNQDHPVWCNHVHLKGHAQTPGHKGYQRYQAFKKQGADGDPMYATYSFCYADFSERFKHVVNMKIVRTQKRSISKDEFARQILGLWARNGATFYPEGLIARGARAELMPEMKREGADDVYVAGVDVAPGQSLKSDYCAVTVWRLRKVPMLELPRMGENNGPRFVRIGKQVYEIRVVYSWAGRNMGAVEMAGLIHTLHIRYRFARIVMDPNGGGLQVKAELVKNEAMINGSRQKVVPICTTTEAVTSDKQPILHLFKRGGDFDKLEFVGPEYCTGDDGFVAAFHLRYSERWNRREIAYPLPLSRRDAGGVKRGWHGDAIRVQKAIDEQFRQLPKVRQRTDEEGRPLVSRRGFSLFDSPTKKDLAYSGLYALAAAELWFEHVEHGDAGAARVFCDVG